MKRITKIAAVFFFVFLLNFSSVWAVAEDAAAATVTPAINEGSLGSGGRRGGELRNQKATGTAVRQESREQIRETRQEIRETRQNFIQQRQEARAQFVEKLKVIRDERKKQIVEKLENRMNEINQNRTAQMLKHLDKMTEILNRIEQKGNEGIRGNKGEFEAAVAAARTAIEAARQAVEAQAGKTYAPNVVDEATLRGVVGASMSQLQQDLKAVREKILLAKKAVMDAALALARARGNVTPVATESGR